MIQPDSSIEPTLENAHKYYPIGTVFKRFVTEYEEATVEILPRLSHVDKNIYVNDGKRCIYDHDIKKWATIISSPNQQIESVEITNYNIF